jgi:hypothetical protein
MQVQLKDAPHQRVDSIDDHRGVDVAEKPDARSSICSTFFSRCQMIDIDNIYALRR